MHTHELSTHLTSVTRLAAVMEAITFVLLFTGFALCALGLIARSFVRRIRRQTVRSLNRLLYLHKVTHFYKHLLKHVHISIPQIYSLVEAEFSRSDQNLPCGELLVGKE